MRVTWTSVILAGKCDSRGRHSPQRPPLGTEESGVASRGFAAQPRARARALLLLNLKKKRDCSQSSGLQSSLLQLRSIWVLPAATRSQKNLKHYDNRPGETLRLLEQLCQHCNWFKSSVWCFGYGWGTRRGGCTCCLHLNMLEKKISEDCIPPWFRTVLTKFCCKTDSSFTVMATPVLQINTDQNTGTSI